MGTVELSEESSIRELARVDGISRSTEAYEHLAVMQLHAQLCNPRMVTF